MTSWYPEQLARLAQLCEGLNKLDGVDDTRAVMFGRIELVGEHNEDMGQLVDEIGGAWSWRPPKDPA